MKSKLFLVAQVIVIVVGSTLAGFTAGGLVPTFMGRQVDAQGLQVKQAAPLTLAGSGFTYQGQLIQSGSPANGQYDFAFSLYDDPSVGNLVSGPITMTNQTVQSGLFTLTLDFGGNAFDGNARYLQISVRPFNSGSYTALTPRQALTPAPYAQFAAKTTPLKNVVTVAQSGGQFTTITAALNSITDNSSTNNY